MKKIYISLFLKYVLFIVSVVLVVFPLVFVFMSSFKNNEEIFLSAFKFPSQFHYENYITIFNSQYHLHTYFFNSLLYAAFVCIAGALVDTMAAYAIGRMKWKLNKPVMGLFLSGIMIPLHALIVPLYLATNILRLPNQFALMFLFTASTIPTSVFLIVGFLSNVPRAVEESAVIDGSTIPYMFFTIIVPIIKPAIATITIFNFMGVWNDLLLSLIFLSIEKFQTLQLGIMRFKGAFYSDYGLLLAAIVLSAIPSIIVYLFMSEKIIGGITAGAVKG
ncbi:MAG: carbohydrate ABC transporter permease [Treponema sp.]|jgi:raffinose/stachyose/melibiose transport system permease protein|nr:carbohydrate ABC transporter permease [Treponema sp.]